MIARKGFLIISAAVLLAACGPKEPVIEDTGADMSLDQQTNKFLQDNNIELPEGAARANLSGSDGTGVATKETTNSGETFTVLADLPEPESGSYYAWVGTDQGNMRQLGMLSAKKGGYVVEKTLSSDLSGASKIEVSREMGAVSAPSNTVLSGEFK